MGHRPPVGLDRRDGRGSCCLSIATRPSWPRSPAGHSWNCAPTRRPRGTSARRATGWRTSCSSPSSTASTPMTTCGPRRASSTWPEPAASGSSTRWTAPASSASQGRSDWAVHVAMAVGGDRRGRGRGAAGPRSRSRHRRPSGSAAPAHRRAAAGRRVAQPPPRCGLRGDRIDRRRHGPDGVGRRQDRRRHPRCGRGLRACGRAVRVGLVRPGGRRRRQRAARQPARRRRRCATATPTRGCPISSSAGRSTPRRCWRSRRNSTGPIGEHRPPEPPTARTVART